MGIEALIQALPISGIEADWLARLTFSIAEKDEDITFLEPPAGQRVPFVDPVDAMAVLFRAGGMAADEAHRRAVAEFALLRSDLKLLERPRLYQGIEVLNVPECVPVPRLISFLKSRTAVSAKLIDFIEQAGDVTCRSRTYRWSDNNNFKRLDEMPKTPYHKAN